MNNYITPNNTNSGNFMSGYISNLMKKPVSPVAQPVVQPVQKPAVVTANVGATSTKPSPSPAKAAYVSSLSSTDQPAVSSQQPSQTLPEYNPNAGIQGFNVPSPQNNGYTDAYSKYIQSLTPSDAETSASKNLSDLSLQAKKDQEEALSRGETLGFASGEAARVNRNNSFGIDAASNALSALSGARTASSNAAKARVDFEKGVLDSTASADKTKFDQNLATNNLELNKSKVAQDKIESDRKFEEDKREYGLDYALKAKQVAIDQQKADQSNPSSTTATAANDASAASSINLINTLLNNSSIGAISGVPALTALLPGTNAQLAKNQYSQIKGLLSLENRSKLKGQGAVSDFEGKVLESAASSLGRNLSDNDFKRQLKQVRGSIATSHGQTADVLLTDPATGKSQVVTTNSAGIAQAIKDGLLAEYQ